MYQRQSETSTSLRTDLVGQLTVRRCRAGGVVMPPRARLDCETGGDACATVVPLLLPPPPPLLGSSRIAARSVGLDNVGRSGRTAGPDSRARAIRHWVHSKSPTGRSKGRSKPLSLVGRRFLLRRLLGPGLTPLPLIFITCWNLRRPYQTCRSRTQRFAHMCSWEECVCMCGEGGGDKAREQWRVGERAN